MITTKKQKRDMEFRNRARELVRLSEAEDGHHPIGPICQVYGVLECERFVPNEKRLGVMAPRDADSYAIVGEPRENHIPGREHVYRAPIQFMAKSINLSK